MEASAENGKKLRQSGSKEGQKQEREEFHSFMEWKH